MAEEVTRILAYRGPPLEPFERPSLWTRVKESKRGLYCIGLSIGGYVALVAVTISNEGDRDLAVSLGCSAFGFLFFLPVLALPAALVYLLSPKPAFDVDARISLAVGPLATLAFFPAAHLLGCKVLSLAYNDIHYPSRISPAHFLIPWLAIGLICTLLLRKAPRLGEKKDHWVVAGVAAAPFLFATMEGVEYLSWSARMFDHAVPGLIVGPLPSAVGLAIAFFAIPILVSLSYRVTPDCLLVTD